MELIVFSFSKPGALKMRQSLITLPQEVLEEIYVYLHGNDLHAVSDTCQTLRQSVGIFALSNKRKMQVLFQKNKIYNFIMYKKRMRLYFTIFHTKDVKNSNWPGMYIVSFGKRSPWRVGMQPKCTTSSWPTMFGNLCANPAVLYYPFLIRALLKAI